MLKTPAKNYLSNYSFEHARRGAAEALGESGDSRAVEPLIAALKIPEIDDSFGDVRQAVALALGKLGDSRAVEPLIVALKTPKTNDSFGHVRQGAAVALGQMGDLRAVDPLVAALKTQDRFYQAEIRQEAVLALGELGDPRAVDPLIAALKDSDGRVRESAAEALGKLADPRAVDPLIAALKDSDGRVRQLCAAALGQLGDSRAVDPLIATLKDSDWRGRAAAAEALGHLNDRRAVEPLIAALKTHDENNFTHREFRQVAAQALGQLGDSRAVEPLIAALKDSDEVVCKSAAVALEEIGFPAVDPLVALLKHTNENVRELAVNSLVKIGTSSVDPLIAAMKDSNQASRYAAANALEQLGETVGTTIISILKGDTNAIKTLETGKVRLVVDPLIAALMDSDVDVRGNAAVALGQLGDPRVIDPLIAALKDSDGKVRQLSAAALGQMGDPRAVEPLITALKDSDSKVSESAAEGLSRLGDARALVPMLELSLSRDSETPNIFDQALEKLVKSLYKSNDSSAVLLMIVALSDQNLDNEFRRRSAKILGALGDPGAAGALLQALKDSRIEEAAAQGLVELGEPISLILAWRNSEGETRRFVSEALATLPRTQEFREAIIRTSGSWDWSSRIFASGLLTAEPSPFTWQYLVECARVILSPSSLLYGGLMFVAGFFIRFIGRRQLSGRYSLLTERWKFGWVGWIVIANLIVSMLLYGCLLFTSFSSLVGIAVSLLPLWVASANWNGGINRWPVIWIGGVNLLVSGLLYVCYFNSGPGGAVLMGVSLTPLSLALFGGPIQGAFRWPRARRRAKESVCQTHFSRFAPLAHTWPIRWSGGALYHPRDWDGDLTATCGCRVCGERQPAFVGICRVIAVLDKDGEWVEKSSGDGELQVNWLKHRKPFDFDAVEVVNATDEEVEAFTNQMRFESDHTITSRLPKLPCRVEPDNVLKDGTKRLLELTFGEVSRGQIGNRQLILNENSK